MPRSSTGRLSHCGEGSLKDSPPDLAQLQLHAETTAAAEGSRRTPMHGSAEVPRSGAMAGETRGPETADAAEAVSSCR